MKTIQTFLFVVYFCLTIIILGGTIFAVMVEYPNWFANVPESLDATRNFYKVLHPGYFFQIFGPLMIVSGIAFIIAGWRIAPVRNFVLVSVALLVAIELLTFLYIYPRLNILFGLAGAQTVEALRVAANEFTFADRIRTGMDVIASAITVAALLRLLNRDQ